MADKDSKLGKAAATLRLLGAPHFVRGDVVTPLISAKAAGVLSFLAMAATPQTRDRVLLLLWPESAEAAARKNLRNTLWTIRTTLGGDLIVGEGDRLRLAPTIAVDVQLLREVYALAQQQQVDARQLQATLALYRGELIEGIAPGDAPEFELWLTAERERVLQQFTFLARQLFGQQRAGGDWEGLERTAQQVLSHDPLNEEAHRAVMEALARHGDRAGALRQYERLRATLERELGAEPLPESEAIYAAIVGGELGPTEPVPIMRSIATRRPAPLPEQGFVGRADALAVLDAAYDAASQGQLHVVVVSGELGIGKSRLWQHWATRLAETARAELQCLEATQQMAFAPLISLFSSAAWSARVAAAIGASLPPWLQALTRLLPSLAELSARPLLGGVPPAEDRQRLFESFVQALLALTQEPHTLFVDDVQWADAITLDWLEYAIHRLRDAPLLLVLTYRSEDAELNLLRRIAQWERSVPLSRLALQGLASAEAGDLLALLGIAHEARQRLVHESAGNPYFLNELARAGASNVPVALADLVRARIESLPDAARQVLQAACVVQPDGEDEILVQVSALDQETALEALDTLLSGGLLVEHEARFSFRHPLVATVVHTAMSRIRRRVLHQRAAQALAQTYAGHLPAWAARIAAHHNAAGDQRQAAQYAELAGDYMLSIAAVPEAVAFFRQALGGEPTPKRHLDLGRALVWLGAQDEARTLLEAAHSAFLAQHDPPGAALALLVLADLELTQGGYEEAGRRAEQALILSPNDPFIAAAAHILVGTAARARGDLDAAQKHLDTALQLAEHYDLRDVRVYGAVGLSNVRAECGDLAGAFAVARDLVQAARHADNSFYEIVGHNNAAFRATQLGNYTAAHQHIEAGLGLAETHHLEMPRQWLYSTRGELALAEGHWEEAESWFMRALAEAERRSNNEQVAISMANLGRTAEGRGDSGRAVAQLAAAYQRSADTAAQYQHLQIGLWLAQAYSNAGQYETAYVTWRVVETQLAQSPYQLLREQAQQLERSLLAHLLGV